MDVGFLVLFSLIHGARGLVDFNGVGAHNAVEQFIGKKTVHFRRGMVETVDEKLRCVYTLCIKLFSFFLAVTNGYMHLLCNFNACCNKGVHLTAVLIFLC